MVRLLSSMSVVTWSGSPTVIRSCTGSCIASCTASCTASLTGLGVDFAVLSGFL
jgi:hypothetical protein